MDATPNDQHHSKEQRDQSQKDKGERHGRGGSDREGSRNPTSQVEQEMESKHAQKRQGTGKPPRKGNSEHAMAKAPAKVRNEHQKKSCMCFFLLAIHKSCPKVQCSRQSTLRQFVAAAEVANSIGSV